MHVARYHRLPEWPVWDRSGPGLVTAATESGLRSTAIVLECQAVSGSRVPPSRRQHEQRLVLADPAGRMVERAAVGSELAGLEAAQPGSVTAVTLATSRCNNAEGARVGSTCFLATLRNGSRWP